MRAPGLAVHDAGCRKPVPQFLFNAGGGARRYFLLDPARHFQARPGKRRRADAERGDMLLQMLQKRESRRCHGHAVGGHLRFQAGEPFRIGGAPLLQKLHPFPHGFIVTVEARDVVRFIGENQPVQEFAPRRRSLQKKPVHLRRKPHGGDKSGKLVLAPGVFAVDTDDAPFCLAVKPGADPHQQALGRLHLRRHRPKVLRPRSAVFYVEDIGVAQTLARHQQADRLQNVGLARAIRPGQDDDLRRPRIIPRKIKPQRFITAKLTDIYSV